MCVQYMREIARNYFADKIRLKNIRWDSNSISKKKN